MGFSNQEFIILSQGTVMKKLLPLFAMLLFIFNACSSAPEIIPDEEKVNFLTDGVWLAILPCTDCEGIDYQLNLKDNFTFKKRFVYKGKSDEQFTDEGTWKFVADDIIEIEGQEETRQFLISDNQLIMLDIYGERMDSEFEEKYHFSKDTKEVKKVIKPKEKVEVDPMFYQNKFADGVDFFAKGNEPGWSFEIDFEKAMVFTTPDGFKVSTSAVEGTKTKDSDITMYQAKSESGELKVTVTKADCQDNMSGEKFAYRVRVEVKAPKEKDFKAYDGCGKYLYDQRLFDIWVMEEMTGINFKKEKLQKGMPQFEFIFDGMRFSGHAGCNTMNGAIDVAGNKIKFGGLVSTMMSCKNMKVEKAVSDALNEKTVTYSIDKMKLTLTSGKTKMVFKKVD